jgi:gamma-glutamylcyclotransferase (GGCT)/AIG2-like uncharacterized protein YtfP
MAPPPRLLVLYGTLRRGEGPHRALGLERRLRYLMPCVVRGRLFDLGPYPGFAAGDSLVHGELFEPLDDAILANLDAFEEYDPVAPANSPFVRESTALVGSPLAAFIYRYTGPVDGFPEIASGDWVAYRKARDRAG